MTGIEPALDGAGKTLVILVLDFSPPWLWVKAEPDAALALPLIAQMFWDGIGKSEGDEVNGSVLLPMRETILGVADFGIRIEEMKLVGIHGGERFEHIQGGALLSAPTAVSNRRSLCNWQQNAHGRAAPQLTFCLDVAAMQLRDVLDDREAEPGAA